MLFEVKKYNIGKFFMEKVFFVGFILFVLIRNFMVLLLILLNVEFIGINRVYWVFNVFNFVVILEDWKYKIEY